MSSLPCVLFPFSLSTVVCYSSAVYCFLCVSGFAAVSASSVLLVVALGQWQSQDCCFLFVFSVGMGIAIMLHGATVAFSCVFCDSTLMRCGCFAASALSSPTVLVMLLRRIAMNVSYECLSFCPSSPYLCMVPIYFPIVLHHCYCLCD